VTESDKRLIEDYLPIQAISAEASREKSVRKGHISTLHLWWARRPLVACRAAVYGALVPASRFQPANGPEEKRVSLGRANASKFVERLCKYPGNPAVIAEAQKQILEAHAERLTRETGKSVTVKDIEAGRALRPKVLDMFAGGGAIPLEALRLGCEANAIDLNPVAYIIELCTLVYPQKYGKPDPNVRGMTGPKNAKGETTWGGLANEVRYWGEWVLKKVKAEVGDLYPVIPDPSFKGMRGEVESDLLGKKSSDTVPKGYLVPVAYLWTRTVRCKNPKCLAEVPLVRQMWLCKKPSRHVALEMSPSRKEKRVRFEVVEAESEKSFSFDPTAGSKGGNAICLFCSTTADDVYVRGLGMAQQTGRRLMAVVCNRPGEQGKVYLAADDLPEATLDDEAISRRIAALCRQTGLTVPNEPINPLRPSPWTRGASGITRHGIQSWGELFTLRQMLCLLTFTSSVRKAEKEMRDSGYREECWLAVVTNLAILCDRVASSGSSLSRWNNVGEKIESLFSRQALSMVWDFAEVAPFGDASGGADNALGWIVGVIAVESNSGSPASVSRGSATTLPWSNESFDAVLTDPPYYDNVPYADISDFFYVWLKRTLGHLYPEHFATQNTPKKSEITALSSRYDGDMEKARQEYEAMMAQSFREAHRVLKHGGELVIVYAHKTTLGWSTLVDALRVAGFVVTEAWPLDTEMKSRLLAMDTAALASSIFLVARKRDGAAGVGNYKEEVRPELNAIVRERVGTLWEMGISGADLVIACVGAGLRAFTRFARVEYANGEEVPAERFLAEVETVVLETILARLSKEVGGNGGKYSLAGLDAATRFYVLWRYTYKAADLDAGEAIVFANGTHVELDGHEGLSSGNRALVEKKKGKYRLRDYAERGDDDKLGMLSEDGQPAPLIDVLHRTLWLMEHRPAKLGEFLREAQPNREQMRLVAQALAGPALKGGELGDVSPTGELSALAKLTANWRSVVEDAAFSPEELKAQKTGQKRLDYGKEDR